MSQTPPFSILHTAPPKACHNCRRRRLRCDRSFPTCHKCAVNGQECLGYSRLLVWNHWNGSGRNAIIRESPFTFPVQTPTINSHPTLELTLYPFTTATVPVTVDEVTSWEEKADCNQFYSADRSTAATHSYEVPEVHHGNETEYRDGNHQSNFSQDGNAQAVPTSFEHAATEANVSFSLIDPFLKDLEYSSRFYLSHFESRVCKDFIAHDDPRCTPLGELVPLALEHPFLLDILIATSALHLSNLSQPKFLSGSQDGYQLSDELGRLRASGGSPRKAFLDALSAKDRAIGYMRSVLEQPQQIPSDVFLITAFFFVNFDLIDTGKGGWRTHLEGASRILDSFPFFQTAPTQSRQMLMEWVISDFVMYCVLGSVLTPSTQSANVLRHVYEIFPQFRNVESSYICCPSLLLQMIPEVSQLADHADEVCPDKLLTQAITLLHRALAFNAAEWIRSCQSPVDPKSVNSRTGIANAHRAAVCLYIMQAFPAVRNLGIVSASALVDEIFGALSQLRGRDPQMKATVWPTFIAAAETRDPKRRKWAIHHLLFLWTICPWGYLFTAIELLHKTWSLQDLMAGDDPDSSEYVCWLHELKSLDTDCLIV